MLAWVGSWPLPTLLFASLAAASGFLASMISFVYGPQVQSMVDSVKSLSEEALLQIQASARGSYLLYGLLTFWLLVATVLLAVMQSWLSFFTLIAAAAILAYGWIQAIAFTRNFPQIIAGLHAALGTPPKGQSCGDPCPSHADPTAHSSGTGSPATPE